MQNQQFNNLKNKIKNLKNLNLVKNLSKIKDLKNRYKIVISNKLNIKDKVKLVVMVKNQFIN